MTTKRDKARGRMIPELGQRVRRRPARMADTIRDEIAMLLLTKIKDPRVQQVSITSVEVSPDLGTAWVYYGCAEERAKSAGVGLASAQGFIRTHLAQNLSTRYVPQLVFKHDETLARQEKIERVLREIADEASTSS